MTSSSPCRRLYTFGRHVCGGELLHSAGAAANAAAQRAPSLSPRDRATGAVVGNLVADAAAVTSHWVYDQKSLAAHVAGLPGDPTDSAPFMEPINPYYHVQPGSLSCYGDQTLALLRSLVDHDGSLEQYMKLLDEACGEQSEYVSTPTPFQLAPCQLRSLLTGMGASSPLTRGTGCVRGGCAVATDRLGAPSRKRTCRSRARGGMAA
jgi:hypothetical protein